MELHSAEAVSRVRSLLRIDRTRLSLILLVGMAQLHPAAAGQKPACGLDSLPARKLVFGYVCSLRGGSTAPEELDRLNYGAVDVVIHGFAEPRAEGRLAYPLVNFGRYRESVVANCHARGKPAIMSIGGANADTNHLAFSSIAADPSKRVAFANHVLSALRVFGYDGVDIDYEYPANRTESAEFTLLMKELHHCLKSADRNYIVMFGGGTGFYLDQMDWKRLGRYSDFACCFGYDWRNPANGPMRNPGVAQWLSGGSERIEASVRGAVDYIITHGFPSEKLVVGLAFYGSSGDSWFTVREKWAGNRSALASEIHPSWLEVRIDDSWWSTPEALARKLSALLLPSESVLTNRTVVRGVGFWEFGHEKLTQPDLSSAIGRWISTNQPSLSQQGTPSQKQTKL